MNRYLIERLQGRDGRRGVPGSGRGNYGGRDGRQGVRGTGPYGIGGSMYSGRDYGEDDYDDMDERASRYGDSASRGRGGQSNRGGSQRGGQYSDRRSNSGRRDMNYDRRYDDYEDEEEFEYEYDMHEKPLELKEKQIKKWEKKLENEDGSRGPKFQKDQILPMAKQLGIKFEDFTEEEFVLVVNMMYSDYCKALKEASFQGYQKPEVYIHMAKAFLCDEDFEGEPYEKLALYYYDIVEYEK